MNGASPRCYASAEETAAFLYELQKLAKRENRGYLAADRNGMPLFTDSGSTGFEFQGVALSPTVQQAAPASLTPSNILAAAEGAFSPSSRTYRGSVMPTWHPSAMPPTPVRLPMFQHPIGKGWGSEPVGTNRKRLGNRAGPPGQTRSMPVPPSPVFYNDGLCPPPLRVRKKTLEGSVDARFSANLSWIEEMEGACREGESWLAIPEEVSLDDCI